MSFPITAEQLLEVWRSSLHREAVCLDELDLILTSEAVHFLRNRYGFPTVYAAVDTVEKGRMEDAILCRELRSFLARDYDLNAMLQPAIEQQTREWRQARRDREWDQAMTDAACRRPPD